jgi:hypothetical protein
MKSSLMKLNHVSTFLGEGQVEILYRGKRSKIHDFRKKCPQECQKNQIPIIKHQ